MLPRQVADDLKHGKPAPATQFTSATIFFRFEDLNNNCVYDIDVVIFQSLVIL